MTTSTRRFHAPVLSVLCLLGLTLASGCDTTHARVPDIRADEAIALVQQDLAALAESPTEVKWLRAYRHFDAHVEPHVSPSRRLELERAFAELRRSLKMADPDRPAIAARCASLAAELQPQD